MVGGVSSQKLTTYEVLSYLKSGRIDRDEVSILFRDHRDLLIEFNHFLPDSIQKKLVDFKEILRFIYMIEMRFQDDVDGVCKSFVDILSSYRYGSKSTIEFSQEVAFYFGIIRIYLRSFITFCINVLSSLCFKHHQFDILSL